MQTNCTTGAVQLKLKILLRMPAYIAVLYMCRRASIYVMFIASRCKMSVMVVQRKLK